ncbi:MAG TPA: sugar ABC transporter substrate-binding protein [Solirubrobacteraceae bacterium]|nr:sugar ABC transporter substrate-binding protein [Solirubrobacteraceae bacterium]
MSRVAAFAVVCAILVGGCGSESDGGSEGSGATVRFQVFGAAEELAAYRELTAVYERRSDDDVRLVEVADRDAHLQKIATGFAAGSPPEVFLVNYRNFAGYAARGVLDAAGPRLSGSSVLDRNAFYRQPLEAFEFGGELQCVPQNVSSLVVYYNRDLFRRAGLKDPRPGWTYREFVQAARALTGPVPKDRGVRRYGVGLEPSIVRLAPFVWSAGGDIVDDPDGPTRFTIDSARGREGLFAFLDLQGGERLAPFEQEVEAKRLDARFLDGELGMFLSSRREVPTFRTIKDFDWDVAAFPTLREPANVLHSDAYCLPKGERADAAWRFVEFAAGPDGQRILARSGRIVPSLKSVAASTAFLDPSLPPRSSQVFLDAIPTIRRLPVASTWPELEDAVDLAIKRAYYTELTVDETLARIERETGPLLRRARDAGP